MYYCSMAICIIAKVYKHARESEQNERGKIGGK